MLDFGPWVSSCHHVASLLPLLQFTALLCKYLVAKMGPATHYMLLRNIVGIISIFMRRKYFRRKSKATVILKTVLRITLIFNLIRICICYRIWV